MIKIVIPSSRPKKHFPVVHNGGYTHTNLTSNSEKELTIEQEIARRQLVIDDLLKKFIYRIGDKVIMKDNDPAGTFVISYIVKKYHEVKNEWPASDNPMLISLQNVYSPKEFYQATTNKIAGLVGIGS
jgi:hypothetical protein